jgi:protein ImuA
MLSSPRSIPTLPQVWQALALAAETASLPTGHAALDAHLPGGGWPVGHLVEVLQARAEAHVWQLVLPSLAAVVLQKPGPVVLVGAPLEPFGPSLAAQGLPPQRLLCIRADKPGARLWAAEQALRCAEVAAVLAWLPQARSPELRRLHLAAHQQRRLLFVMRTREARQEASPARLRLLLEGVDEMQVHILKRRGPPLAGPVVLPARPARLEALLQARRNKSGVLPDTDDNRRSHVLDRPLAIS